MSATDSASSDGYDCRLLCEQKRTKFCLQEWNVFAWVAYFYKKVGKSLVKISVTQTGSNISYSHGENA